LPFNLSEKFIMAQIKSANAGNQAAFMQAFGNTVSEVDTTTVSTALAVNDTVDIIRIAGGTFLYSLETFNEDLDTGTGTLAFKLGYRKANSGDTLNVSEDDDYFGSALATWAAAVLGSARTRWAFAPIYFSQDVIITATVTTAANAMAAAKTITTIAQGIARGIK
jgi:hypothetical protein